jgi:hypothetical protein
MNYSEIKHSSFSIYEVPMLLDNKQGIYQGIQDLVNNFRPGISDRLDLIKALEEGGLKNRLQPGPGIQIGLHHSDNKNIYTLQSIFNTTVLDFHNTRFGRKGKNTFGYCWTYVSHPSNKETNYHDHIKMSTHEPLITNTWTWVYYLELPNNCSGDEGKIFFSHDNNDSNALKFFPKKDTLYIFPGSLGHRPELSPNSTLPRITLAGNVFIEFKDKILI